MLALRNSISIGPVGVLLRLRSKAIRPQAPGTNCIRDGSDHITRFEAKRLLR
jgi:hypothetical protein